MHKQLAKRHEDGEGGFTLVELLVVITILGILAAIVVFSVGGINDTGKKSACQTTVKTVEVASEAYRAKVGRYAGSLDLLTAEPDRLLRIEDGQVTGNVIQMTTPDGGTVTYGGDNGDVTGDCPPA